MRKHLPGCVVLALAVVGSVRGAGDVVEVDYQKRADKTAWEWADEKATVGYCMGKHLKDFSVERADPGNGAYMTLYVKNKEGKELVSFPVHDGTVFARSGDTLVFAEFNSIATGCTLIALDLKSGKELWKTRLKGLGPIAHTKYRNRVNIEVDGKAIAVRGFEAAGRYLEFVDIKSGKTLANRVYRD